MNSSEVIVFVKDPDEDPVKTRLGRTIGESQARCFYILCLKVLSEQLKELQSFGLEAVLAITSGARQKPAQKLLEIFGDLSFVHQGTGNIGERICRIDELRRDTGAQNILYIGSDAPTLPTSILSSVLRSLEHHDVSLAPAEDGGFTVLASRVPLPSLEHVRWSQPETFSDTYALLVRLGLNVSESQMWYDVDEWPDLLKAKDDLSILEKRTPAQEALFKFCCNLESGI